MTNVLPFKKKQKKVAKRSVMCENNHHKWVIEKQSPFDVRTGKLITVERCKRCQKRRTRAI